MSKRSLDVSIGQYSIAGQKDVNQDFHGVLVPKEPAIRSPAKQR